MTAQPTRTRLDQAIAMVSAGRNAEARTLLLRIVQQSPRDQAALSVLVASLAALGEYDTALYYADRAVSAAPTSPGALANRARVRMLARKFDEGIEDLRAVIAAEPGNEESRAVLVQVLESRGRLDEAMAVLDAAPAGPDDRGRLAESRAMILLAMGRADEALAIQKAMIPRNPSNPAVAERAAVSALYAHDATTAEIKELASRFGRLVSVRLPVARTPFGNDPDPDRRLRIGFVGGDFRNHASMRFFEPLAAAYDKARMEFVCYMTADASDAVTARVRALVDRFHAVHALRVPELAAQMRSDGLDVLIDLSGHTVSHRLECFHYRPAPVQMTWYGQPSTTGLTAMDYRIVDSFTDPDGFEAHSLERLLRLDPCGFAFHPGPGVPEVQEPPSQRESSPTRGRIVFGSYSNLTKLNNQTFALWARILRAVPGSELRLRHVAFGSPGVRAEVTARLAAAGLGDQAAHRVRIDGPTSSAAELLPLYHDLDIALDTFPYSGMTTTCESLTMGVPVVTLAMDRSASRYSHSILMNCGLGELSAATPDDYVQKAVALALDGPRLAEIRRTLRGRFARVVGDGPGFANRFELGIREAWRTWCEAARRHSAG